MSKARRQACTWRRGVRDNGPPGGPSGPVLDRLSAPALASLRAAWWTKRLLTSYGGTLYDATHLYDQSGNGKTLTSGAAIGTAAEGADTALVFNEAVPNSFTRGDALGLAADPALTIVWKMKCTADFGTFPTLLSVGTAGDSELSVSFEATQLDIGNFEGTSTNIWAAPTVTGLDAWNTWALTKPAASGYSNAWRLYRGVTNLGAPAGGGLLTLGNTGLILGDFDGGGFPFGGHLAGMLVFEREFTGADLAVVQGL